MKTFIEFLKNKLNESLFADDIKDIDKNIKIISAIEFINL